MKYSACFLLVVLLVPNSAISTEAASTSPPPPTTTSAPPPPPPSASPPPPPPTSAPPPPTPSPTSTSTPPSTTSGSERPLPITAETTPATPSNETLIYLPQSTPWNETLIYLPPSSTTPPSSPTSSPTPPSPSSSEDYLHMLYDRHNLLRYPFPMRSANSTCPESDQIHCGTGDRCTRIRYICDGDNDCGDNTDEAPDLCRVWRNLECERNMAKCTRLGRTDCVTIRNYCQLENPPCEGDLDRRLCVMLQGGKLVSLGGITLPTTAAPTTPLPSTHEPLHVIEEEWADNFEQKLSLTISHPDCPQLYTQVGDLCLSVFFIGNMTWLEARAFCKAIGGDLFTFGNDIAPYTTILQHLANSGIASDFWIGGRFVNSTVGWQWVDETPLQMGSPYWAVRYEEECSPRMIYYTKNTTVMANDGACYHYQQAPPKTTSKHCVAATYRHYWYLSDENCFTKKSPLCVIPGDKRKQAL